MKNIPCNQHADANVFQAISSALSIHSKYFPAFLAWVELKPGPFTFRVGKPDSEAVGDLELDVFPG